MAKENLFVQKYREGEIFKLQRNNEMNNVR